MKACWLIVALVLAADITGALRLRLGTSLRSSVGTGTSKRSINMMSNTETIDKVKGFDSFVRTNPMSDKIAVQRFHHIEYYTITN